MVIWRDNDEAGQRYTEGAFTKLVALGCNVTEIAIHELGLPAKGDCVDWISMNGPITAADISALPKITCGELPGRKDCGLSMGKFQAHPQKFGNR